MRDVNLKNAQVRDGDYTLVIDTLRQLGTHVISEDGVDIDLPVNKINSIICELNQMVY